MYQHRMTFRVIYKFQASFHKCCSSLGTRQKQYLTNENACGTSGAAHSSWKSFKHIIYGCNRLQTKSRRAKKWQCGALIDWVMVFHNKNFMHFNAFDLISTKKLKIFSIAWDERHSLRATGIVFDLCAQCALIWYDVNDVHDKC